MPKRIIAQTMIPNPQGSMQTNQGPYIEIKFFPSHAARRPHASFLVQKYKVPYRETKVLHSHAVRRPYASL